jgi:cell division protease FtsH
VRLVLQISALLMLSRLLGAGMGKSGAGGAPAPRVFAVPYSEFVRAVRSSRVATVQVDGVHILWQPRAGAAAGALPGGAAKRGAAAASASGGGAAASATSAVAEAEAPVLYSTTRPADAAVPYEQLLGSGAQFGAPDKRAGNRVVTVMVRTPAHPRARIVSPKTRARARANAHSRAEARPSRTTWQLTMLYVGIVVSMLGRLPLPSSLRFPGRGGGLGGTGRQRGGRGGSQRGSGGAGAPPDVTFADVAGVDEAKEELEEVVAILKAPERFAKLGARPPTGVLLVGAPGTGKTLLARAVAGEAGVPFFSVAASEFVELYVGMGASRVRDVFARAKAAAPAIVFIDEIDAVAKGRSDGRLRGMGNDEREQTLNQLLTELDGFDSSSLVICLAATNRPDTLDAALRRPGRFDRTVAVERPDRTGREQILNVHVKSKGMPLAPGVNLSDVAAATVGFTGAELATLVNEAALLAARRGAVVVDADAFTAAVLRSVAGIERKRSLLFGAEKACVARHEAGHALVGTAVSALLPANSTPRVEAISIVARSNGALGYAYSPPSGDERSLLFADELRGRLVTLLAGRAAEELSESGRVSTGASDDISRATELAYRAVAEFGMCAAVGPLSMNALSAGASGGEGGGLFGREGGGGETAAAVEREVAALLKGALAAARAALLANAALLDTLGGALEADERVAGARLAGFLAGVVPPPELRAFVTEPQAALARAAGR